MSIAVFSNAKASKGKKCPSPPEKYQSLNLASALLASKIQSPIQHLTEFLGIT